MASQIFNFPGFFDREIDLTTRVQAPVGTPAGVIGAAEKGPAFVPITVGSFTDFETRFGTLNPRFAAPYAADKFLENKTALTFIRILGAGSNATQADIDATRTKGTVKNAGFVISGTQTTDGSQTTQGDVQFIVAKHFVSGYEASGFPMFTDNNSVFSGSGVEHVNLVRGTIFAASDSRIQILSHNEAWSSTVDDVATPEPTSRYFKIVISSSAGSTFANDEGFSGIKIFTASLNPADDNYFAKLLNTDPEKFAVEKHLLYADFAVDSELAVLETGPGTVALASGSANLSATSGDSSLPWLHAFGKYNTRYTTPRSPSIISQPFGGVEHDLFYFEAISDGAYSNSKFKISITNLKKSSNPRDKHGSFTVLVRTFNDTDFEPKVVEQFNEVNLNPNSSNFIGKVIGDTKATFNFDVQDEDDRRLTVSGKFANKSRIVRVVIEQSVTDKKLPAETMPFGFRGFAAPSFNSLLADTTGWPDLGNLARTTFSDTAGLSDRLLGAIVPPLPLTYKVTRGNANTLVATPKLAGTPGNTEVVDSRIFWGVKYSRNSNALNPNIVTVPNKLVETFSKFAGIEKLDVLITGSGKDSFNNNKFTLARVALGNSVISDVTSSANTHMKEAVYIRNGQNDGFDYTITDTVNASVNRVTFASLLQKGTTAADFNKFSNFTKFTIPLLGGFDGTNILDKHAATFDDRSTSTDSRSTDGAVGNASTSFTSPGLGSNQNGAGTENSTVSSYRVAADIITDSVASNINLLALPGQRDSLVTDYTADAIKDFSIAFYTLDIPNYDSNGERIWDGETARHPDVEQTANNFESRALDNEAVGTYFPDVAFDDTVNNRRIVAPASVAAYAALGFNDRVAFPWFAPAGFNRASLDFVTKTRARLVQAEQERLFAVHINPIIKFPRQGHVIFGQNTLEQAGSALGSINVVRMLNDVKKQIIDIGNRVIFEQADRATREQLTVSFTNVLNTVTARQGIERFKVIINDTNNTAIDVENNKINAKIILVPTRAIEFVAIDFVITNNGVQFTN